MDELRTPTGTPRCTWGFGQWLPLSLIEYGEEDELHAVLLEGTERVLAEIRDAGMRPVTADLAVKLFAVERAASEEDQFAHAPLRRERVLLRGQAMPDWAWALEAYWTCQVVPADES